MSQSLQRKPGAPGSKASARGLSTGRQNTRQRWLRHFVVAGMALGLTWFFWSTRPNWVPEMRLWKAVGDTAYVLLIFSLSLGPLSRLLPKMRRWTRWRRQLGIWFALTSVIHAVLILDGWAEWSLRRFLGYEFVPQLGREARMEPGFGLANLIGIAALTLALILAATSSDRAVKRLGRQAWLWLHRLSQTVLILALLHGGYFLFIHFTASFHKVPPGMDWFRMPFLAIGLGVVAIQALAFLREHST